MRRRGLGYGGPPSPALSQHADADDDLMDLVDELYNGYGEHDTPWRCTLADVVADAAAVRIRAEAEHIVRGGTGLARAACKWSRQFERVE